MAKPLLIIGIFGIALAIGVLIAKRTGSQGKLDRFIEWFAWFGGVALIALALLLAFGHFTGSDYIAATLERFLRWLHS